MTPKIIFFDCDGVLVDNTRLFSDRLSAEYGISKKAMQPFFSGPFRQCSLGLSDLKEELAKVVNEWGWEDTVDNLVNYWLTKGTVVDQEVVQFIREIKADKKIRCIMTTDQEKYRGQYLKEEFGNGKLFEKVYFSAEVGVKKKHKKFWDYVIENVGGDIDTSEMLVVDDDTASLNTASLKEIRGHLYTKLDSLKNVLV